MWIYFLQNGLTALFSSVYQGLVAITQVLLSAGANPNLPTEVCSSRIMLWHGICRWLHVWVTNHVHEIVVIIIIWEGDYRAWVLTIYHNAHNTIIFLPPPGGTDTTYGFNAAAHWTPAETWCYRRESGSSGWVATSLCRNEHKYPRTGMSIYTTSIVTWLWASIPYSIRSIWPGCSITTLTSILCVRPSITDVTSPDYNA